MTDTSKYSADELLEFAKVLDEVAASLPVDAPGEEGLEMNRWSQALGGAASNLRLLAVEDYIAQTQEPLRNIIDATKDAKKVIANIKKINKAIEVVGDIMLLATAIWLQKWALVIPTLNELRKDIKA